MRYRVEHEKRNSISPSNHLLFHNRQLFNYLLTTESQLNSRLKKKACCHSLVVLNRASDVPAADWLSQTHMKNYHNFSHVVMCFFSVVGMLTKHSSLCNKLFLLIMLSLLLFFLSEFTNYSYLQAFLYQ